MTKENLTKEERENIMKARDLISDFAWKYTKEGYIYWDTIYNALKRIAESNVNTCPHCHEVLEE